MKTQKLLLALILGLLLLCQTQPVSARSYDAGRFDVIIEIQPDGSFIVTETVIFRFFGGPYSYAFRELDLNELDEVEILDIAMDGVSVPRGSQPGQVEVDYGDPIKVTWHFPESSDQSREFVLTYRVIGNIRQDNGTDMLSWQAIPGEHEYEILSSTVQILFPENISTVRNPEVRGVSAEVEQMAGEILINSMGIPPDTALVVSAYFPGGSLISEPPDWQKASIMRREELRTSWPYAAGAGGGVLAMLLGLLALFRRRFAPEPKLLYATGVVTNPPDELPPALAASLLSRSSNGMLSASASIMDLARRGFVNIVENEPKGLFRSKDFIVQPLNRDGILSQHEIFLMDFINKSTKKASDGISLSKFGQKFSRQLSKFSIILNDELREAGLVEPQQLSRQRALQVIGTMLIILSLMGIFFSLTMGFNGSPGLIKPLLIFGAGCLATMVASILIFTSAAKWDIYTVDGASARLRWESFRTYLKELTSRDQMLQSDWFDGYLPFALAIVLGERWVKAFKNQGLSTLIPYVLASSGGYADGSVFVAAASATSASSSGGGAGGGGGGSSGAG